MSGTGGGIAVGGQWHGLAIVCTYGVQLRGPEQEAYQDESFVLDLKASAWSILCGLFVPLLPGLLGQIPHVDPPGGCNGISWLPLSSLTVAAKPGDELKSRMDIVRFSALDTRSDLSTEASHKMA